MLEFKDPSNINRRLTIQPDQIKFENSSLIGGVEGTITAAGGNVAINTRNNLRFEAAVGKVEVLKATTFREVPGAAISGGNVLTIYLD